jgi:hypothetical protein
VRVLEEVAGLGCSPQGESTYIEANNMTVRSGKSMISSLNVGPSTLGFLRFLDALAGVWEAG